MAPDPFWYEVGMFASIFGFAAVLVGLVFDLQKQFPDSPIWRKNRKK